MIVTQGFADSIIYGKTSLVLFLFSATEYLQECKKTLGMYGVRSCWRSETNNQRFSGKWKTMGDVGGNHSEEREGSLGSGTA
jgi:hypothetical protein